MSSTRVVRRERLRLQIVDEALLMTRAMDLESHTTTGLQ